MASAARCVKCPSARSVAVHKPFCDMSIDCLRESTEPVVVRQLVSSSKVVAVKACKSITRFMKKPAGRMVYNIT